MAPETHESSAKSFWDSSIENALELCRATSAEEVMFIGGAKIYEAVKDIVDEVHLTEMNLVVGKVDGEVVIFDHDFVYAQWPDPENSEWKVLEQWKHKDSETGVEVFEYTHLVRK